MEIDGFTKKLVENRRMYDLTDFASTGDSIFPSNYELNYTHLRDDFENGDIKFKSFSF